MRNPMLFPLPEAFRWPATFSRKRAAALLGLILILFFLGIYTEHIYLFLDKVFLHVFTSLGLGSVLRQSQAEVSAQITMRSWPTMATYGLLYTGLSFLILHVYLNDWQKTKLCAAFYASFLLTCVLLIGLGKLVPEFKWAYMLCRRLIEMIVSPFPIVLLLAVFAGFSRKNNS